ncbi:hypothetical protein GCM10027048_16560 [Hymenobacter coalescens]
MANREQLRTDDFDDRGRNQYEHNDNRRPSGMRRDDTYEQRHYGHSQRGEESRASYTGSGSRDNYGQRGESRGYDQRSRHEQHHDEDRHPGQGNQSRGFNTGPQGGGSEYYRRDNSQFRSYHDDTDRREYPARRDDDAPSYIHYSHQRPGGITPRDYHEDDARVRGHETARGRDQYSRGYADRGNDHFYENYHDDFTERPAQQNARYNRRGDDDRDEQRPRYDGSNRDGARSDYGYGDDYSSSLYDPNSRNSAFRRRDDRDDRRGEQNRRWSDTPDLDNRPNR